MDAPFISFIFGVIGTVFGALGLRRELREWMLDRQIRQKNAEALDAFSKRPELPQPSFDVTSYEIGTFWRDLGERSRVTAIVSGKGGVGKSVIGVALAEHFAETSKVLLVDFDLHNRGLTSKLGSPSVQTQVRLWTLLERYRKEIVPLVRADLRDEHGSVNLRRLTKAHLVKYRDAFCYIDEGKDLTDFSCVPLFQGTSVGSRCVAKNCYFLPSRALTDSFLASEVSRLDIPEVAIFVKCLATLAARALRVDTVILDCHGAHDLFMAGAIVASEDLVVVSRPELSAFEGTIELVSLSKRLVDMKNCSPERECLVMNEIRPADQSVCNALVEKIGYPPEDVVRIAFDERVISAQRDIICPSFFLVPEMWSAVGKIAERPRAKPGRRKEEMSNAVEQPQALVAIPDDAPGNPAKGIVRRE